MVIRLNKLGGTDWGEEGLKPISELVPTLNKIVEANAGLTAESNYKTLDAANSFTNGGSSAVEQYTDATGLNDTVNTGSTTANFDTDKYELTSNPIITNSSGVTLNNTASTTNQTGAKFQSKINGILNEVNITTTGTAPTKAYLLDASKSVLSTVTLVGTVATFNYPITNGTSYYVTFNNNGSTFTWYRNTAVSYPITSTDIDYTSGIEGTNDYTTRFSFVNNIKTSNGYETSNVVVHDTNTLSIDDNTNSFLIHHEGDIPDPTSIDYDINDGTPDSGTGDGTNDITNTSIEDESGGTYSNAQGIKIEINENLIIKSITKHSMCTGTIAYIKDTEGNILEQSTFVGDVATFTSDIFFSSGDILHLEVDNNGSNYTRVSDINSTGSHTFTYPISGTYLDIVAGSINMTPQPSTMENIASILTQTATNNNDHTINLPINPTTKKSALVAKGALTNVDNAIITCNLNTIDTVVSPTSKGFSIIKL